MSGTDPTTPEGRESYGSQPAARAERDDCANIADPVRRTLCKVCNAPVVGNAPFCQDHEPPVP